ncbi:hypothetical protein AM587_10013157 [Phytophthora nicotianae]|uniref:Uncharacterized protein n=1 Tax=Phytophthora nicotianae TaxID=4792 RepID=A0A0W8BZP6_PHYNI|nr:hypothetical protein AM587_10013157 [Phytophthora nicotianae]
MEPKSGKLHKLGLGFFGPKWTEKWVHLDGTLLKCFPMAVEQQIFSLGSSRRNSSYELMDYKFAVADEKKVNRKFAFQLEAKTKSRLCLPADAPVSPVYDQFNMRMRS